MIATLLVAFGLLAVGLACLGLYGRILFTIPSSPPATLLLLVFSSREVMGNRMGFRIAIAILALATVVAVSTYSYNLGLARGLADNGRTITFAPGPWGFGFGFFPLFPFLFIFFWFWFFVLRALFWRGPWGRPAWRYDGVPPAFDEWHRRAHARQDPPSPAPKADAHA